MDSFKQWEMALDLSNVDDAFEKDFKDALAKNKKKVILYHGTSTDHFWSIVNNGFYFDPKRKNWDNTSPGNYFSFHLPNAEQYAYRAVNASHRPYKGGDEEGIIFVLEVPIAMIERDLDDSEGWDKTTKWQSVIKDLVNPKYITGVIYPVEKRWETPLKKFINLVNRGKIPSIPPEQIPVKRRFTGATMDDLEHAVGAYVVDLIQYTTFMDYALGNDNLRLNQKIIHLLNSMGKNWWQQVSHWTGDNWVKVMEDWTGVKNTEDYYKTQPEFVMPMWKVINRYHDIEGFRQTRLAMKPKPRRPY